MLEFEQILGQPTHCGRHGATTENCMALRIEVHIGIR